MGCIKGRSICETCGIEFEWSRHESQPKARFCRRKCTNRTFGTNGNKNRLFWPNATEEQKFDRIKEFYEKKVIRKNGCWDWNGSLDKNGYPQIFAGSTKVKGHRISYEMYKGKIPVGLNICHTCDNPKCTNPEHLWAGTKKQNDEDKIKKGRISKGEHRYNAKLKENNIKEIRKMLEIGLSKAKIARHYNVSFMTISCIEKYKTWKHVV